MTDGTGTTTYVLDPAGNVLNAQEGDAVFSYSYNPDDQVTSRGYPTGGTQSLTYTATGQIATATDSVGTTGYQYDPDNRLASMTMPDGSTTGYTYNGDGAVTDIDTTAGATIDNQQRTLNTTDLPTKLTTTTSSGSATDTYTYNDDEQLTSDCRSTQCRQWTYDPAGNRTKAAKTTAGITTSSTTSTFNADNELTKTTGTLGGTTNYTYNALGQMTSAGTTNYTYNVLGEMLTAATPTTSTSYIYDGNGNRTNETTNLLGLLTTANHTFSYDNNNPQPELITDQDQVANTTTTYYYANGLLDSHDSSTTGLFRLDALGNVTDVTNLQASDVAHYSYDPYGTAWGTTPSYTNPRQFQSGYTDTGSILTHLDARDYNPTLGAFTTTDPLAAPSAASSTSSYAYADDQPTDLTDPTGQSVWSAIGSVGDTFGDYAEGIGDALVQTADSLTHPIRTWQAMAASCTAGLNSTSNGTDGLLQCIDNVNPIAGIRRNFTSAYQALEQGCGGRAANLAARGIFGGASIAAGGEALADGAAATEAEGAASASPELTPDGSAGESIRTSQAAPSDPGRAAYSSAVTDAPVSNEDTAIASSSTGSAGTTTDLTTASSTSESSPGVNSNNFGTQASDPGSVNAVGGTENCASCAIAGDSTLAGSPASAIKLDPDVAFPDGVARIEAYADSKFHWSTGRPAIERELEAAGNGARGIVYGLRANNTAHVFNAIVQRGSVNFVDFQRGGAGSFKGFVRYAFIRTG